MCLTATDEISLLTTKYKYLFREIPGPFVQAVGSVTELISTLYIISTDLTVEH